ncbi:MadC family VWA domain-containing protein [Rhodococcus tibetensis]|uniref:VWA domain-containing protein n=1 Tax=Rhodococcus tibetensis TaxID=2965064 RepID=A0ABT1QBU5_9NOCA|nr:VWA domain-containing protein [Rhodococcus sp. FXJ9.536]MCQ4119753.1 VWA domain-containing protein [Rhodococcus sp. FXJ9.536]
MSAVHSAPAPESQLLDVLAASFGTLLRQCGVAASPAEVIEVRRVLGLVGAREPHTTRAALRAVCAKYTYEQSGFDRAFDVFFGAVAAAATDPRAPSRAEFAAGLPTALEVADNADTARYAEYNERAAEVGDHFDTPEAEKGFNPHKDDDDVSMTSSDAELSVDSEADSGHRGVTYTVEVERAASTAVGDLASSTSGAVVGSLSWDDPESILAWLDAYDPSKIYADSGADEPLTAAQLNRLAEAVEAFVGALAAARDTAAGHAAPDVPAADSQGSALSRAEVNQACHEVLRRMRGPTRPRPRELARGRLDMRRTVRASLRTEGIPFHLMVKAPRPDRVRVLILADVSLSVRPVTAFTLRLAQAMHRRASRCQVLAFVDRPVDVTDTLLAETDDDALALVLADPRIDLEASSDYGRVFTDVLTEFGTDVNSRTSVVVVGDGRCNGLPPGVDEFAELRRKVHRLAWITPEPERYWNQASCAMPQYAEICDRVVVARDAVQLMARAAELGHALR